MSAANQAPTILDYAQQLIAGTSAILAFSFGGDPAASNRTGFYGDLTASAEKVAMVVGGQTGPIFTRNGSVVDATFSGAVTITGNLTVNGTTTTINSATLNVDDRVIRVNYTTGANDPVPAAITGLSVNRGAIASVARDAYGLFWDETNSLWKFAVNTGADDATLGAYLSLRALTITGTTITASAGFSGGTGAFTTVSASGVITSTLATGTAPFTVASTTVVANLNVSQLLGATWTAPGTIGSGTPSTGAFTTISATGAITSTLATGTAPFTVASTTNVANLNASSLSGATFSAPGAIGGGTASSGAFTSITASSTLKVTGATNIIGNTVWASSTATAAVAFNAGTVTPKVQLLGAGASSTFACSTYVANGNAGAIIQAKSRNVTPGSFTIVQAGDNVGVNAFEADDGTQMFRGLQLVTEVAGTPAAGVVQMQLKVSNADAAGTLKNRGFLCDPSGVLSWCSSSNNAQLGLATYDASAQTPQMQVGGTDSAIRTSLGIVHFRNSATIAPRLTLAKGKSNTWATYTVLADTDTIADIVAEQADGTDFGIGAKILFKVDGTPGNNDTPASITFQTWQSAALALKDALTLTAKQNVVCGNAALATNATDGFIYLPTCAGTPTGVPTAFTGRVAWVYDTTNNIIYVYNGAWKKTVALT